MAQGATGTRVRANARLSDEERDLLARIRAGELQVAEPQVENEDEPQERETRRLHAFILNPTQIASIESGRGRKPVDPAYLSDMKEMILRPGEYAGYRITQKAPASVITSKIRRAARECNLGTSDYSVYVREKDGFVSFTVHASAAT